MLKIKLSVKRLFLSIVVLVTVVGVFTFILPVIPAFQGAHGRKVLLQKTDYEKLLKAGRELISKAEWEEYVTIKDGKRGKRLVIPKDIKRPKPIFILQLKLLGLNGDIEIGNDYCLNVIFGNRVAGTFGVRIFPSDFNEPANHYDYGDEMLIPGMWYFDDGYIEFGPEYGKKIENMIKKNRYLKEEKE